MRIFWRVATSIRRVAGVLLLMGALYSPAQETAARITGTIADSTGALIPSATVTVVNEGTGVVAFRGHTDSEGSFTAPQLPIGQYTVTVEAPEFKKAKLTGLSLSPSQVLTLPVTMNTGGVSEIVTVSGESRPQLEAATDTMSTVITPAEMKDLPMTNRDVTQLFALIPGAVHGGAANNVNNAQLFINGSRTLNTEILLDGSTVVNAATGNINRLPSPDFLSEFSVITSNGPAEYGRTAGAVVTMATKSGTSTLHGGIYELFRNAALNANTYFNNLNKVKRPVNNLNQFGFTLGGPIYVPHFYEHKDKTFFFLNYDQTVSHSPGTATLSIPGGPFRNGDFSSIAAPIRDPQTNKPFPGNIIPASRFDAAAKAILASLPAEATNAANNYFTQQSLNAQQPRYSGRIDHQINSGSHVFGAVTRQIFPAPQVVVFNPLLNPSYACDCDQGWEGAFGYTQTIAPTLVLNVGGGASRDGDTRVPTSQGSNPTTSLNIGTAPAQLTPQINITNYASVGTATGATSRTYFNGFTYYASVTKILGPNAFKSGAQFRKNQLNIYNPGIQPGGAYSFTGEITSCVIATGATTCTPGTGGNQANALADFLLGQVKTSSYGLPQPADGRRNYNIGAYLQDDYKVNSKLMFNLGLRWEYESPQTISNNQYSRIDPSTGILLVAGKNASSSLNITTPKANFAPRIGLVYSASPKTVFRAGYGNFYGLVFANLGGQVGYPGYEVQQSFNNLGTQVAQPFTLSQGMPLIGMQNLSNPGAVLAAATAANPYIPASTEFARVNPMSLEQEWNLGVQQDIFAHTVVEMAYVASHGVHLPLVLLANLPSPSQATAVAAAGTTLAEQLARPFQTLGSYPTVWNVGNAHYNSLQVTGKRQFTSNVAFLASYVWSHSIDDGSGIYNYSQPNGMNNGQYPSDPTIRRTQERSSSAYDLRHNFTFAGQFTSKGRWWMRNFQLNPIFTAHSGLPLTVTQTNEFPGLSDASSGARVYQRPNGSTDNIRVPFQVVGTSVRALRATTDPQFNLTPSGPIFTGSGSTRTQVVPTALGTLGRYTVRAPGEINLDASASRTFHLHELVNLQFRVDVFNLMNHTNFAAPNTALSVVTPTATTAGFNAPGFGLITSANPPRTMQLVARINF